MKVNVPPIKSQGIKTKLIPWIKSAIPRGFNGVWIEPFMGTGAVGLNLAPSKALLCDTNPHLINFYNEINNGKITADIVRDFLKDEGSLLLEKGEEHYYYVRSRFNESHSPLDFLFLNRAGFNGMIRFNKKGGFNIPFCKKPSRFNKAYVTKIVNQVDYVSRLLREKNFIFKCQSFEFTIAEAREGDLIYCDPPYIGRHVDYFNGWNGDDERLLHESLSASGENFLLSTWHHNNFRKNEYIDLLWGKFHIYFREHFYHVGGSEKNRNPMIEAMITNYEACMSDTAFLPEQIELLG